MVNDSKRKIIVGGADLCEKLFVNFLQANIFSHPMNIDTFPQKNADPPKQVVDFPRERDTFRNKSIEIVGDFDEKKLQQKRQNLEIVEDFACESNFFIFHLFSFFQRQTLDIVEDFASEAKFLHCS